MSQIFRFFRRTFLFLVVLFILPALASQAWWQLEGGHARSWNTANWSSAGILPEASADRDAVIYVMAARTGRWKGGFAVHSWIVTKKANAATYNRYDKVGWGSPIRRNGYDPDANWYSNPPEIVHELRGDNAARLIPEVEKAVASYAYSKRGDYQIWPGPNSNTFIAHVLNAVPELGFTTTPNAVGRNFLGMDKFVHFDPDQFNLQVNFRGLAGFAIGRRHGLELHFLGLVTGFDLFDPALKLPGFGRIELF